MAHFAELDENNIVLRVMAVHNDYEEGGAEYCNSLFGGRWVQTSYNANFRKNYAAIGYTYDAVRDAFIAPRPLDGDWVLDENTCTWVQG